MPDIPALSLPIAKLPRRLAAMVYDLLVICGVSLVYGMIGFGLKTLVYGPTPVGTRPVGGLLFQLGWAAVLLGFYLFFWHRAGQTIGMRTWRLKLINNNGELPSIAQCLARCLAALLSFGLFGLGYWWSLFDREHCTWHDRLTKTRVVLLPKPSPPQTVTATNSESALTE